MKNLYVITWGATFNDNYNYGSNIEFLDSNFVKFSSPFMPAGKTIKTWYSETAYQLNRDSPMLPLLKKNQVYNINLVAEYDQKDVALLVVEFFNINGDTIKKIHFEDLNGDFEYPKEAMRYEVKLVNKKHKNIIFKYLIIRDKGIKENFDLLVQDNFDIIQLKENKKEILKNNIVIMKKNTQTICLSIRENQNYIFILCGRNENNWLKVTNFIFSEIKNNYCENTIINFIGGSQFNLLDKKYKMLPMIFKLLFYNYDVQSTLDTDVYNNLENKLLINQYSIDILKATN